MDDIEDETFEKAEAQPAWTQEEAEEKLCLLYTSIAAAYFAFRYKGEYIWRKEKKTRWNSDFMSCHRENLHLCCVENHGRECMVMMNYTCISIICLKSASAAREMEIDVYKRQVYCSPMIFVLTKCKI